MKYTGWGTTLFLLLLVAMYAGKKVDEKMGNESPYIAVSFMFVVLIVQFYKLIKDLS